MSSLDDFISEMRNLIRQGDTKLAIEQLTAYLSGAPNELYNDILLLSSRFNRLQRDMKRGLINSDLALAQQNQLDYALLSFLDQISSSLEGQTQPIQIKSETLAQIKLPEDLGLESILGINNLKQISWIQNGIDVSKSVCRILTPNNRGTGFLIQATALMTNNHVIPSKSIAEKSFAEFNYQQDASGGHCTSYRYRLDTSIWKTSHHSELDYTIVGVAQEPEHPEISSWGQLDLNPFANPVPGEHVVIVQHPNGGLKQIVLTANQVIETQGHLLHYSTDTMPGSSGSPVLNDAWKVVAIHHAGESLKSNSKGQKSFANEGILMSAIKIDANSLWPA